MLEITHVRDCALSCPGCYLCGQELDKKRPYDHYKEFKLHLSIH